MRLCALVPFRGSFLLVLFFSFLELARQNPALLPDLSENALERFGTRSMARRVLAGAAEARNRGAAGDDGVLQQVAGAGVIGKGAWACLSCFSAFKRRNRRRAVSAVQQQVHGAGPAALTVAKGWRAWLSVCCLFVLTLVAGAAPSSVNSTTAPEAFHVAAYLPEWRYEGANWDTISQVMCVSVPPLPPLCSLSVCLLSLSVCLSPSPPSPLGSCAQSLS